MPVLRPASDPDDRERGGTVLLEPALVPAAIFSLRAGSDGLWFLDLLWTVRPSYISSYVNAVNVSLPSVHGILFCDFFP